jgi:SAM-dependent methyltransferase
MLGQTYFEGIGAIVDGIPQCAHYLRELEEVLGAFPRGEGSALEIGCGTSMYCPGLLQAGFGYLGLEPCEWAAKWTSSTFSVPVTIGTLETFSAGEFDLILAAHSLEHMDDAPGAIRRCADMLHTGGEFWVIIPNDDDPLNPDHIWFFDYDTMARCLRDCGLEIDRLEVRRRIERERFIYARGTKV